MSTIQKIQACIPLVAQGFLCIALIVGCSGGVSNQNDVNQPARDTGYEDVTYSPKPSESIPSFNEVESAINAQNFQDLSFAPYALNDQFLAMYLERGALVGMVSLDTLRTDSIDEVLNQNLDIVTVGDTLKYKHSTIQKNGKRFFLVEGDILLNRKEYLRYLVWLHMRPKQDSGNSGKLVGEARDGRFVRWPSGQTLKYAVIRSTFDDAASYRLVVDNMEAATRDWQSACNIQFEHDQSKDGLLLVQPTDDLSFIVMEYDAGSKFIAQSFFPYQPADERVVLIDPSYFATRFNKVGVLRHELGHVMGFRHEQIRSEAPLACPDEILTGAVNLTKYDPSSVMHYFCGDVGKLELEITEIDRLGAQVIYGPPRLY